VPKRATCDWNSQACPRKPIAIPELLDYWAETDQCKGALVTIDAVGCKAAIADKIFERIIGDLLQTEINEKRAGSIQSQFEGTPINDMFVTDLVDGGFIAQQRNAALMDGTGTGKPILLSRSREAAPRRTRRGGVRFSSTSRDAVCRGVGLIFSHACPGLAERRRRRCRSAPQQRKILNITPLAATLKWLVHRRGV
jgi:hypothetical protein